MVNGMPTWSAVTIDFRDRQLAEFWSQLLRTPIIEPGLDRPGWLRLQPLAPVHPAGTGLVHITPGPIPISGHRPGSA